MNKLFPYLLAVAFMILGCTFDIGNKTVGVRSGQLIFIDGSLKTDYRFAFEKVWSASNKTLVDMKATSIEKSKKIALGTITGIVGDEKVTIMIDYLGKEQTMVSVMVGPPVGNSLASRLIHDKIAENLIMAAETKK